MTRHGKKILLICVGFFFVALGTIGIFLPLLPTVPFLLIALWAFAQSSQTFHDWLYHHKHFGPMLQEWSKYGTIPLKAKIMALSTMTVSALWVIFGTEADWKLLTPMVLFMGIGAGFILSRPSRRPNDQAGPSG